MIPGGTFTAATVAKIYAVVGVYYLWHYRKAVLLTLLVLGGAWWWRDSPVPVARVVMPPDRIVRWPDGLVTIDAHGSRGSHFAWSQLMGYPVRILHDDCATMQFVPPAVGMYVFQLTVTDGPLAARGAVAINVVPHFDAE